jgi:solute carrier family 25 (adenine nucleotide translocator) protein 4/5/6/31
LLFYKAFPSSSIMADKKKGGMQQVLSDLAVGGISGAITKTAMSPIERVKILMQTQDSNPDVMSGKVERYKGIGDCFSRVNSEQGVKAFWRGNLVNCIRYAPQQGSALAFNDALKQTFPKFNAKTDFWAAFGVNLVSGGMAGGIANTICYPFDFARTRLASDVGKGKKTFNGIMDCIMKTVNASGITGLYRGWSITVAGAFVYRAGQLGTFAQIMAMNPYKEDKGITGMFAAFLCAQVARNAVMPFNYPFDTVRRRVMLESEKPPAERTYKGSFDCAKQIMAKEGFKGMYKGMIPELARGVGGSMVIVAYDRIKEIFGI